MSVVAYVMACVVAKSAKFLTGLTIILVGFVRMLRECGALRGGVCGGSG